MEPVDLESVDPEFGRTVFFAQIGLQRSLQGNRSKEADIEDLSYVKVFGVDAS